MLMKKCYHVNCFLARFEVDRVWKPMKQCPMDVVFDLRKLEWGLRHSLHHCIKLNEEVGAKSGTLRFIPSNPVYHIEFSFVP